MLSVLRVFRGFDYSLLTGLEVFFLLRLSVNENGNQCSEGHYYGRNSLSALALYDNIYSSRNCNQTYDESQNHSQSLAEDIRPNHIRLQFLSMGTLSFCHGNNSVSGARQKLIIFAKHFRRGDRPAELLSRNGKLR